jgi:hypothetical protein
MRLLVLAFLVWYAKLSGFAETPKISRIAPLAIRSGETNVITVFGEHLESVKSAWLSGTNSSARVVAHKSDRVFLELSTDSKNESVLGLCVANSDGVSDLQLIATDALPLSTDRSSNTPLPGAVDALAKPGTADAYKIELHKSDHFFVEIVANRLGSMLTPLVRLLSPAGKELIYGIDVPSVSADSAFDYPVAESGLYKVEVRDIGYQGGANFFYHLKLFKNDSKFGFVNSRAKNADAPQEQEPNDSPKTASKLEIPDTLFGNFSTSDDADYFRFTVTEKQRVIFAGRTREIGSPCDLKLTILDHNAKRIAASSINGTNDGVLTNVFGSAGTYFLKVDELAGRSGPNYFYELRVAQFQPGFELSTDINKIDFASTNEAQLKITAHRFDYGGPITISVLPPGAAITLKDQVIPAKKNEITLKLKVAETNASHLFTIRLEGKGDMKGTGSSAQVSVKPALQKLFPLLIHPPESIENLIFCLK